jgi:hypothetical protein
VKLNAGDFEVLCSRYSVRSVSHNNRNVYKRCNLYLKLLGIIARRKLKFHASLKTANLNRSMVGSFQLRDPSSLSPAQGCEETSTLHLLPVKFPTSSHIFLKLSSLCLHLVLVGPFLEGCPPALTFPTCLPSTTESFFSFSRLTIRLQTLIWSSYPNKWRKNVAYMISIFPSSADNGDEGSNTSPTIKLL